jgi:hypothetical protein
MILLSVQEPVWSKFRMTVPSEEVRPAVSTLFTPILSSLLPPAPVSPQSCVCETHFPACDAEPVSCSTSQCTQNTALLMDAIPASQAAFRRQKPPLSKENRSFSGTQSVAGRFQRLKKSLQPHQNMNVRRSPDAA